MTKLELDINEILDYDSLSDSIIENLSEDIHHQNPEWWAEKVCKPMQADLKESVRGQRTDTEQHITTVKRLCRC